MQCLEVNRMFFCLKRREKSVSAGVILNFLLDRTLRMIWKELLANLPQSICLR